MLRREAGSHRLGASCLIFAKPILGVKSEIDSDDFKEYMVVPENWHQLNNVGLA